MQERELIRIAYAPAGYHRLWRRTYLGLQPAQQRWLNDRLIRQRALPAPPRELALRCSLARQLTRQWSQLPQVAMLMAAARLRRWVLSERASLALPISVQAFMRLGHAEFPGPRPTEAAAAPAPLMAWGGAALLACTAQLPEWLHSRLPLHFHGLPVPAVADTPDADLLWSALRHAEKVS